MILFKNANELTVYLEKQRANGTYIGFVPTMGALHNGHLELIKESKNQTDLTVCSIFVNPTQFNNKEDFQFYPITIEKDIDLLCQTRCDILFLPSLEEIYPVGYLPKQYQLGDLENILEGFYRPGHFQGVCQVVDRLLQIVMPGALFMGQKDYQQCMVIRKLLALNNWETLIKLVIVPTIREKSGLAMSSRNLRLSAEEQQKATAIYKTLSYLKEHIQAHSIKELQAIAENQLALEGFKIDYVAIANAETLQPALKYTEPLVGLVAVTLNKVRLIDNMLLNEKAIHSKM